MGSDKKQGPALVLQRTPPPSPHHSQGEATKCPTMTSKHTSPPATISFIGNIILLQRCYFIVALKQCLLYPPLCPNLALGTHTTTFSGESPARCLCLSSPPLPLLVPFKDTWPRPLPAPTPPRGSPILRPRPPRPKLEGLRPLPSAPRIEIRPL